MKKTLTIILSLVILCSNGYSQTLTATDCNPVVGNSFRICQPVNFSAGPSGANMTWNFIDLFCSGGALNTDTMIAPSAQFTAAIPGTNMTRLIGGLTGGTRLALNINNNGIEKQADYNAYDTTRYSNPETMIFYPMIYGKTYTDTYSGKYTYTVSTTVTNTLLIQATKNFTVDASGTLVTPEANFPNALRVYSRAVESYTTLPTNAKGTGIKDKYAWYAAGAKDAIVTMEIYEVGTANEYQVTNYLHNHSNLVGLEKNERLDRTLIIYPNPALNSITIESENQGMMSVINDLGQVIQTQAINNEKKKTLDISNLNPGIYFVRMVTSKNLVTQKKLVIER